MAANLALLTANKISGVVNLVSAKCPDFFPAQFAYYNYEISDRPSAEILAKANEILDVLHAQVSGQKRMYVHCMKGISRAPTIAIAYLMRFHGLTFDGAFDLVREKVKHAEPNAGFLMQLASLAAEVRE